MCIHGFVSRGPASRSNTRYRPLSDNRAATTAPADPAPDTIKSNVSSPLLVPIPRPDVRIGSSLMHLACAPASALVPPRGLEPGSFAAGPRFKIEPRQTSVCPPALGWRLPPARQTHAGFD